MVKVKFLEIEPFKESLEQFENRINKFTKGKEVIDIKFAIPTERGLVCEQRFHTVMIMYEELTKEEEEAKIAEEQLKNYVSYDEYINKEE